jgi:hypothetical protein
MFLRSEKIEHVLDGEEELLGVFDGAKSTFTLIL